MTVNNIQGIAALLIAFPSNSLGVLSIDLTTLKATLDKVMIDESLVGVILDFGNVSESNGTSAGLSNSHDPQSIFDKAEDVKALFRRLETWGNPVVAILSDTTTGAMLEMALACHYRIALDRDDIHFGFPEVAQGLLPGGGGVVRTGRLIGLQDGLEWLTRNKLYTPKQAHEVGMIHALANDVDDLMAQARAWIAANPAPKAPWDQVKRYKIPGGGPTHPKIAQMLAIAPAMIRQETKGRFPAPIAILSALVEGAQVDFETACRIESRYFTKLAMDRLSRA
jgi:3-hydroxyacyl-CoA dehydrogenase/enoyl-CoA hydratase/3-hydroxybutyryl-CoA epimerase